MILADFGAEVVKIEPPGGDHFRDLAASPVWLRGKFSIELDLHTLAGRQRLHELAADADVAIASYRPGSGAALGADPETLRGLNPRLVYCSITGWGPRGRLARVPGYEGAIAAKSGYMMTFEGQTGRAGPGYAYVQIARHGAAQSAIRAILAALLARERSGRGQLVETSLLQGMLSVDTAGLAVTELRDRYPEQFPPGDERLFGGLPSLGYQPYPTADGRWIQMAGLVEHLFHTFIAVIGLTEIYAEPQFAGVPGGLEAGPREELRERITRRMLERDQDEWMRLFVESGNVAAEPWRSPQEAMEHPQIAHNGDVIVVDSPTLGPVQQIGPIARLPLTPANPTAAAPSVSAARSFSWIPHTTALASSPRDPAGGTGEAHKGGPLDGVTVLEFASIIAAPYACSLLAELGARVIKIEPLEGDGFRSSKNPGVGGVTRGLGAINTTSDKESLCIDMKSEEGLRIARELIARADILVHNYRPGVPERLGIGYADVRALNDRIVYVSAWGYGADGPYANRPTAAPGVGAAMGGAYMQAGGELPPAYPEDIPLTLEMARRLHQANPGSSDYNAAHVIATAAMLGYYARERIGAGQHVETNMLLANAYTNIDNFVSYAGCPTPPRPDRGSHGLGALYRLYEAAAGWVFFACGAEREWSAFTSAAGRPDLATDPRFCDRGARVAHEAELATVLADLFATRNADEWERLLTAVEVACVRADAELPGSFWYRSEHARENGFIVEVDHPIWGRILRHGPLSIFSDTPAVAGPQALAGQHTQPILEELGYEPAAIESLVTRRVVAALDAPSM